ncbi:MAG: hypothetical protein DRO40_00950 [Thermoprotei archaeon]|nr:MAG: hypothetical protein DRO40_00950 [Thermoprotei archaeon]
MSILFKEVFVPTRGEAIVREEPVHHVSGIMGLSKGVGGTLLVSNRRVAFLRETLTKIVFRNEEIPVRHAYGNIGYERLISVNVSEEKKLFLKQLFLEIIYETLEGLTRKIVFKTKDPGNIANDIRYNVTVFRSKNLGANLFPQKIFMNFVEFLAVEKAVKPLLYDSVSRCIVIGTSYFCITDLEWNIEGSKDILDKAKNWINEFRHARESER